MSITNINRVLSSLQEVGPSTITDLVNCLGLSRSDVVAALFELELQGKIRAAISSGKVEAV